MSQQINLRQVEWTAAAEQVLQPVVADCEGGIEDLRRQVETGAGLFEVTEGEGLVGYYVLRVDTLAAGRELVVVAGAGRLTGVDLLAVMLTVIEAQARATGCRWLRIHTNRKGMYKRLPALGYMPAEVVYRKDV